MKLKFLFLFFIVNTSFLFSQEDLKLIRQGNKQYEQGKYKEAEIYYRKALEANPKEYKASFNTGDALYKQGNYEEAAKLFESIANLDIDKESKANILHNLGNSYVQNKKYQEGIDAYKQSLRLNPKDEDTRYNYAYAKSMLTKQQQQQQQQQKNQQNKDQQKQEQKQNNQENMEKQQEKQQQQQNQQMSKEQAERMLEALNQNEKDLQDKLKKKAITGVRGEIEKDW